MADFFFITLSALTIASALMVVLFKSPVHSALSLVLCLVSVAGHFALLNAHFLAMIQIALYAGAIVVLVLFVIMLLNLSEPLKIEAKYFTWTSIVVLFVAVVGVAINYLRTSKLLDAQVATSDAPEGTAEVLGLKLFTDYLWQFELASLLILSAVIGTVLIASKSVRRVSND